MTHAIKAAFLSTCALMLASASPALASPGGFGGGDAIGRLMAIVKRADLTSQQEQQIQTIRKTARAQGKTLAKQWAALHQQLADKLLASGTPTMADFSALTQQLNQLHAQEVQQALQTALQIRAVLTPAQLSHIAQIHQQLSNLNAERRAILQDDGDMPDEPPPPEEGR